MLKTCLGEAGRELGLRNATGRRSPTKQTLRRHALIRVGRLKLANPLKADTLPERSTHITDRTTFEDVSDVSLPCSGYDRRLRHGRHIFYVKRPTPQILGMVKFFKTHVTLKVRHTYNCGVGPCNHRDSMKLLVKSSKQLIVSITPKKVRSFGARLIQMHMFWAPPHV